MAIEGKAMERQPEEAGVPQGSPSSPIQFAIYTARLSARGNRMGAEGFSLVYDIGWIITGKDMNEVVRKFEE